MPNIIRNGKVSADNWSPIKADAAPAELPGEGDLLLPLAFWLAHRDTLLARQGRLGVLVDGSDDPAVLGRDLQRFELIAINFPQFTDGRGYSLARLLRERYGYRGELRAVGDVIADNLFFLASCGFDAFALKDAPDDTALSAALAHLGDFSDAYQSSVTRPQPLFRRRLAANSGVIA
jgi:uncharacterized protein (DUF934 family)